MPDDGNKYELVRGELFVTPLPTDEHETILARLTALLVPFVAAYWIVDPEQRTITVVQPGMSDRVEHERFVWQPPGASAGLDIQLGVVFGRA